MNIRFTTPMDLSPTVFASSVDLMDKLVKGALTLGHALMCQNRGKCAAAHASPQAWTTHTITGNISLHFLHWETWWMNFSYSLMGH